MARKRKWKSKKLRSRQAAKERKWQDENATLKEMQRKAPHFKKLMRLRGCDLPFYDYLDSYPDEFQRIADAAIKEYPSLLGVHEVDDDFYEEPDRNWDTLGYRDLTQVFFDIDDDLQDYGKKSLDSNLAGFMTTFLDSNQEVRSTICIRRAIKTDFRHGQLKYLLKIASLCHEIGHVHDLERGKNFDVAGKRLDVIEAEVYAHLFALNMLAERNLRMSYELLLDGLKDAAKQDGYLGRVASLVVERTPEHSMVDWLALLDVPPTPSEVKKLGPQVNQGLQ